MSIILSMRANIQCWQTCEATCFALSVYNLCAGLLHHASVNAKANRLLFVGRQTITLCALQLLLHKLKAYCWANGM